MSMSQGLKELLGQKFLKNEGEELIEVTDLNGNDQIGIYFSAHWCPPCRDFTPKLAQCYNTIKGNGKKFEIVFVSSDRDEASFAEYFKEEMPWLAIPFTDGERRSELSKKYGVSGLPTLVLLDSDGEVVTTDGRSVVTNDPAGEDFPWEQP